MKKTLAILLMLSAAPMLAADITITIPDAQVNRVLNAIAETRGYTGYLIAPTPANPTGTPETKAQFARRMMIVWIIQQVKEAEGKAAVKTATDNVNTSVDSIGVN